MNSVHYIGPVERWLGNPTDPLYEKLREKQAKGEIADCLTGDFRKSFRYSNGKARAQAEMACLIGMHYFYAGTEVQESARRAMSAPEEVWRMHATPPSMHSSEDDAHIEREGRINWLTFQERIDHAYSKVAIADMQAGLDHYGDILSNLAHIMIDKDIKYLTSAEGRPKRPTHKQRYNSFFRAYVLDSQSTGSLAFNQIFKNMRDRVIEYPPNNLVVLAAYWRYRHNDEFYPENFLALTDHHEDVFYNQQTLGQLSDRMYPYNYRFNTLSNISSYSGAVAVDQACTVG